MITYSTDTAERTFLMSSGKFAELWVGIVVREDERGRTPVWTSNGYADKKAARFQATLRKAECAKYLATTGRDWKDDRDAERAQEKAAKQARVEARKRLTDTAPALLEALKGFVDEVEAHGDTAVYSAQYRAAKAAIGAAEG